MKTLEIVGFCPHCHEGNGRGLAKEQKSVGREVDIFAERDKQGALLNIYVFGDDHFDMKTKDTDVLELETDNKKFKAGNVEEMKNVYLDLVSEASFSDNEKNVIDIVCPRCKEHVAVGIPIIKEQKEEEKANPSQLGN